jgi:hypothetical protein
MDRVRLSAHCRLYVNSWTIVFAWMLILFVWFRIFRQKDPALGDLQ